jgi:hypothetical protein
MEKINSHDADVGHKSDANKEHNNKYEGLKHITKLLEVEQNAVEWDMRVRSSDGKFEDKVFAKYPLIGSKIIKPDVLEKLNENTRQYIDEALKSPNIKLPLRAEMQITLALINYAKNWKNESNSNFWDYISLQFGYRDSNGTVVKILQKSLEDAMKKNNRLFVEDLHGRGFKATAVVHAMATRKSWMALFDFLFDFYKNNLNWKIIPGEPLVDVMIRALQLKLSGKEDEETEMVINSQVYFFQEGIRKLILLRPAYTRKLFMELLVKINALVNSIDKPNKTYEEQLCEDWFKKKITLIANTKRSERQVHSMHNEVAINYSTIRVRYILKHEDDVQILIPDIRLKSEEVSKTVLTIYNNHSIIYQKNMSWYGNELGKTLHGVSISLPKICSEINEMAIVVSITCDGEEIYNSEDTMKRKFLIFSGDSEVVSNRIRKENYTIVVPHSTALDIENADITEIESFKNIGLKAFFIELKAGYIITVAGQLISFDNEYEADIRIISPGESVGFPTVLVDDVEYYLAYKTSVCNIIFENRDFIQQYIILLNGEKKEFTDLHIIENTVGVAFSCPLVGVDDTCRIQIINLNDERLVYDKAFILTSKVEAYFNRDFYYSLEDYENAEYSVCIDGYKETVSFTINDTDVSLPFKGGILHARIPKIELQETTGEWMYGNSPVWYVGDIPQNSMFRVSNPVGISVKFLVAGNDIMYDGQGIATIGNVILSLCNNESSSFVDIEMLVKGSRQNSRYLLTRVSIKEQFLKIPEFWTEKNRLYWNHGGMFIGKVDRTFTLSFFGENESIWKFEINENTEYIEIPDSMEIGNYQFEISLMSEGLFKKTKKIIAEGCCIIGDANLLRFRNKRIVIDSITDEFKENEGRISINTCFIDQIRYVDMEETSEGRCPIYQGIMYTEGLHGERYEFSFDVHTNKRGYTKMMVNPVRIVYVSKNILCITDSDGDGLYYYHYYDKDLEQKVYALTDHEYTSANKHKYSNADLYSYRTERI